MLLNILKFLVYVITFPLKLVFLICFQIYAFFSNPQKYNSCKIPKNVPESLSPTPPNMKTPLIPEAGYPNHSASRTGELVDIGYISRLALREFVDPNTGEINRGPLNVDTGNNVSGDMLCGWLQGYTSKHATGDKPKDLLIKLSDWMIREKEGPTTRLDAGWRRNPLLVGTQASLALALYWTTWKETNNKKYLKRYILLQLLGYGILTFFPNPILHKKPKSWIWIRDRVNKLFKKNIIIVPYNIRSLYNDANFMRCLAVLQRQTSGIHRWYYKMCAKNLWRASKNWHLPFMDKWGLGYIRKETKDYVNYYLSYTEDATLENGESGELWYTEFKPHKIATAPVLAPEFGEAWDDERYRSSTKSRQTNGKSIGPYFEWFYANRY